MLESLMKFDLNAPPQAARVAHYYTDGSGDGHHSGWSAIQLEPYGEFTSYAEGGTNNAAEMMAVILALEVSMSHVTLVIHSDSKFAMNALSKRWRLSPHLEEIKRRFQKLCALKAVYVRFEYVQGHDGNKHNERADRLAKDALLKARRLGG